jgi:hypothetical protein
MIDKGLQKVLINFILLFCKEIQKHNLGSLWIIDQKPIYTIFVSYVITSAGNLDIKREQTEEDWSIEDQCNTYEKSKLLAEKAAWKFVQNLPGLLIRMLALRPVAMQITKKIT